MRNGYRLFDPVRGMDYILDLMYLDGNTVVHRIHLVRPIAHTKLLNHVCLLLLIAIRTLMDACQKFFTSLYNHYTYLGTGIV